MLRSHANGPNKNDKNNNNYTTITSPTTKLDERKKRKERLKKTKDPKRYYDKIRNRRRDQHFNGGKILTCITILFVTVWFFFTIYTLSKISEKVPTSASKTNKPSIISFFQNIQDFFSFSSSSFFDANRSNQKLKMTAATTDRYQMAPSISERVPIIDMRQLSRTLPFDNPDGGAWKQGWDVQPIRISTSKNNNNDPVRIFVVPHSHCDPGWIKTFDEYFQSQTKQILSTIVSALAKDSRRTFIWAEISYFEWWWKEQDLATQQLTKQLINNHQLEFVTGGWVQPDEANTQLYAMEVQLQEGHDWLRKTFGAHVLPKYGWSIDPFGYSPTMAYLLKKYNFKGMLIQRVHYAVKKELAARQHLEFNWRQTWDTTGEHDIFCHVMPFFSYDVPHTCGPDPSVCCQFDFARMGNNRYGGCPWNIPPQPINSDNVKERSLLLLDQYLKKASLYRSNTVIAPLGDDFRYQTPDEAEKQYTNYQKIFDYINANVDGVQIQFGTLSNYFEHAMGTFEPPLLMGSFFTYSDVNEDYWSGYYTSRVFDKSLDRALEQTLFAAESLGANKDDLQQERRALSLFQHHDGVTGTAKDHVVLDYAKRIHSAIRSTQDWMSRKLETGQQFGPTKRFEPCWRSDDPRGLRRNECDPKGEVYLYNPLKYNQSCGDVQVKGNQITRAVLPCDQLGPLEKSKANAWSRIQFDPVTGLMTYPVKEEWMTWQDQGGAYLFKPVRLDPYQQSADIQIDTGGFVTRSSDERGTWSRQVVERTVPSEFGDAIVIDFIYETNLQSNNQDWVVRFEHDIANQGIFHTDLNGFNFDTHYFRSDLPLQSQVFPMPTLSSIEDEKIRMTILSDHAQGTASLKESSIDVWLDRRLARDDSRGLGQGVMDNVPTRTRLRLLLEPRVNKAGKEFQVTPLCRRMWEELQHPLEMFGLVPAQLEDEGDSVIDRLWGLLHNPFVSGASPIDQRKPPASIPVEPVEHRNPRAVITGLETGAFKRVVPFVFMVYKRVDFFKKSVESLLRSDFPRSEVPLIVSHDGHFQDFVSYVETLKDQGFWVIELFHPYSCADHPDTFPGDDPSLNQNYQGDAYGNPRTASITCCKHHFTWLMTKVYSLDLGNTQADNFLFLEEDYVVAPTIYSAIDTGLNLLENYPRQPQNGFFGLVLDTTDGFTAQFNPNAPEFWFARRFVTGPMVLPRAMYEKIKQHAKDYCKFDDYNWDWSFVHLQGLEIIPHTALIPSRPQVLHIGFEGGMHEKDIRPAVRAAFERSGGIAPEFRGTEIRGSTDVRSKAHDKGFGGWGHPADQQHCMELLTS